MVGTSGYVFVEGWTFLEAFYQTVLTISTVGFKEVHPLSDQGMLFTAFLIIGSFGTFAYAVTSITTYLVGGEYRQYFREYKELKEVEGLAGHVIICGYGRVGLQASKQLELHNEKYLIIEQDPIIVNRLQDEKISYVSGDSTQDEVLLKAGVKRAKALITTLPSDADNLFTVLTAREICPTLTLISRASTSTSVKKLKIAGADNVIMPDTVGGAHMASLVVTPDVVEFLDEISIEGKNEVNLEEICFADLPEDFQMKTIGDLDGAFSTGCNIIGFRKPSGEYIINPPDETELTVNSKLFVLGNGDQIRKMNSIFGIQS